MANLFKKIKARLLRLPVFVFNNKRKHKSYIFKGNKENFYSLIITHSEYSGKRKNLKFDKNDKSLVRKLKKNKKR